MNRTKKIVFALTAGIVIWAIATVTIITIKERHSNSTFRIVGSVTAACQTPFADDNAISAGAQVHIFTGNQQEIGTATLLATSSTTGLCRYVFIADKIPGGKPEYTVMIGHYRSIPRTEVEARAGLDLTVD